MILTTAEVITDKVVVITSLLDNVSLFLAKIIFVVAETTFKVTVITYLVDKVTL